MYRRSASRLRSVVVLLVATTPIWNGGHPKFTSGSGGRDTRGTGGQRAATSLKPEPPTPSVENSHTTMVSRFARAVVGLPAALAP